MFAYEATQADRAGLPPSWKSEPRYLGYREPNDAKPHAKYFRRETLPIQRHVRDALLAGMSPNEYGFDVQDAARLMSRPGYLKMETGWTQLANGTTVVACLTDMPGVIGEMWDWWFGWHCRESARYKLWYPGAHQYSGIGQDRSADRFLTDKQRYLGNVSYVDEYIGGTLGRLAIRFVDPSLLGFDDPGPGGTIICARVGPVGNILSSWLVHQVRATGTGTAEMRSRFFLNHFETVDLPTAPNAGVVDAEFRDLP